METEMEGRELMGWLYWDESDGVQTGARMEEDYLIISQKEGAESDLQREEVFLSKGQVADLLRALRLEEWP